MASRWIPQFVIGLLLVAVGYSFARAGEPTVVTVTDTVTVDEYKSIADDLLIERDGLLSRLRGITERAPEVVYVVDTLIAAPDTVIRFVTVDGSGRLSYEMLSARDSLYAPEIRSRINVSNCDDGYQVLNGSVLCNKALLGHLWVGAGIWGEPQIMAWWRPSYRSSWELGVGYGTSLSLGARFGFRIF
jgi:hypothetical protein